MFLCWLEMTAFHNYGMLSVQNVNSPVFFSDIKSNGFFYKSLKTYNAVVCIKKVCIEDTSPKSILNFRVQEEPICCPFALRLRR